MGVVRRLQGGSKRVREKLTVYFLSLALGNFCIFLASFLAFTSMYSQEMIILFPVHRGFCFSHGVLIISIACFLAAAVTSRNTTYGNHQLDVCARGHRRLQGFWLHNPLLVDTSDLTVACSTRQGSLSLARSLTVYTHVYMYICIHTQRHHWHLSFYWQMSP